MRGPRDRHPRWCLLGFSVCLSVCTCESFPAAHGVSCEKSCTCLRVHTSLWGNRVTCTHVLYMYACELAWDSVSVCACSHVEGLAGKPKSPPPRTQPLLPGALMENRESPNPAIWDGGFCWISPPSFLDTNSLWNKGNWGFRLFIQSTLSKLWSI